jgi:hypothetical protein
VIASLRQATRRFQALPTLQRELLLLALLLLFALLVLPSLVWIAGQIFLGDYLRTPDGTRTGGPLALTLDFIAGLFSGSMGHWLMLLGPYLLVLACRGGSRVIKM